MHSLVTAMFNGLCASHAPWQHLDQGSRLTAPLALTPSLMINLFGCPLRVRACVRKEGGGGCACIQCIAKPARRGRDDEHERPPPSCIGTLVATVLQRKGGARTSCCM